MTKSLFIGVSVCFLFILTSCGQKSQTEEVVIPSTTEQVSQESEEISETNTQPQEIPITENVENPEVDLESNNNTDNMEVKNGSKVAVHYTGTLEDGTKFDSSHDRGTPLEFTAGAGQMIPGFDAGVMGMKVGDKKTLTLNPGEAYGEYDESRLQVIPRQQLASFEAAGFELKVGEKLPTQFGNFTIKEATDENITLDTNHELAGKTLIFDVELVEIK